MQESKNILVLISLFSWILSSANHMLSVVFKCCLQNHSSIATSSKKQQLNRQRFIYHVSCDQHSIETNIDATLNFFRQFFVLKLTTLHYN